LSKQDDFVNQLLMLETVIKEAGHKCVFLPKFHCKLNPIEMVFIFHFKSITLLMLCYSIGVGVSTGIEKSKKPRSKKQSCAPEHSLMHVPWRLFVGLSINRGNL